MKVIGVEGLSAEDINRELERGGKFVVYQYCISIAVLTFKRPSSIHFIKAGESGFGRGVGFTLLSLVTGWWGIPWGPIYTIESIYVNSSGGRDVTKAVIDGVKRAPGQ